MLRHDGMQETTHAGAAPPWLRCTCAMGRLRLERGHLARATAMQPSVRPEHRGTGVFDLRPADLEGARE